MENHSVWSNASAGLGSRKSVFGAETSPSSPYSPYKSVSIRFSPYKSVFVFGLQ